MNYWANYHSHSHYCDGSDSLESYIDEAVQQHFPAYGFSSHGPVPFRTDWNMQQGKLTNYIRGIAELKRKYADGIQIYLGLEIDFLPDHYDSLSPVPQYPELDYRIGSIHFVERFPDGTPWNIDTSADLFAKGLKEIFNNNMKEAAIRFWEITRQMIDRLSPDIIGHLDKIKMFNTDNRYFSEEEPWYREQVDETLHQIKSSNSLVEINTRGYYRYGQKDLYPGEWIIRRMAEKNIPVILSSDAHKPEEISAGMAYAAGILKKCGIKELYALYHCKWKAFPFEKTGLGFSNSFM